MGIVKRVDGALEFAEKLLATNPTYAKANPLIAERIKKVKEEDRPTAFRLQSSCEGLLEEGGLA